MNASNNFRRRLLVGVCAGGLLGGGGLAASAQMVTPLHVGSLQSIRNEFGNVLPGNAAAPGCIVVALWASNSVIYPPAVNGQPNPGNPPVAGGLGAIGQLVSPEATNPGTFGMSMADPRPNDGAKFFLRVFNKSTVDASSFYADSQVLTASGNKVLEAEFGATTNALDTADDDSDGLNNSWEKSYGTSPNDPDTDHDGLGDVLEIAMGSAPALADTDGDGVPDGHEWRSGTDLLNPASYLGLSAASAASTNLLIRWSSITGHWYQVECTAGDLLSGPAFSNISEVIAAFTGTVTETTITNTLGSAPRVYRVRLVEP